MSSPVLYTTFSGFPELRARIQRLANDPQKVTEVRNILRKVAGPTVAVARSLAPRSIKAHVARGVLISPGNLAKSIGIITGKNKTNPTIYVGARAKGSNNGWYAHFVHDGHNVYARGFKRKRKKNANNHAAVSRTKANPFLQKAFAATGGSVTAQAESQVAKYFQKRINALSR